MRKGIVLSVLSGLLAAAMLAGCGSSKSSDTSSYFEGVAPESAYDYAAASEGMYTNEAVAEEYQETADTGAASEPVSVADSRKLIRNVQMSVETENLTEMLSNVNSRIKEYGGYAEYSTLDSGYASIKARIPSSKLDAFVNNVEKLSNVTYKSESAEDITLQYVDTKSRVESLKIEQNRLNELLAEADSVETIIALESRLSEVRYELQSYESQLRTYDNLVDYSTVQIDISEVKAYTPQVEATRWERMTRGFVESLYGVAEGFLDFIVGFIIALPFLIVWAIVIFIIVLIIRAIVKSCRKNSAKRLEKRRQQQATQQQQMQAQQQKQPEEAEALK